MARRTRAPAEPIAFPRTALVTGGNRGLGLEICRRLGELGLTVYLGARDRALGEKAAASLQKDSLDVRYLPLDVGREESVAACAEGLAKARVELDALINNAGVYPAGGVLKLKAETLEQAMNVNFTGAFWLCRAFVPRMIQRGYGRVVNVSSGFGSFGEALEGPAAYSISKAALNALTVKLAQEVDGGANVKVNAACPGWVKTRMGGNYATRGVIRGAAGIVWLATLPEDGPHGRFFRDMEEIPW